MNESFFCKGTTVTFLFVLGIDLSLKDAVCYRSSRPRGANVLVLASFKTPLRDFFLTPNHLEVTDLGNSGGTNRHLSFLSTNRRGLDSTSISSSIVSPTLELEQEQPSIELDPLVLDAQVGTFQTEFNKEETVKEIEEEKKVKVEEARSELKAKETDFNSAVEKVEEFFSVKPDSKVRALTLPQKQALAKAYKVFSDIKQAEREASLKLSELGSSVSNQPSWKTDQEVSRLLSEIHWQSASIKFQGSNYSEYENWQFDTDWNKNPWKEFFKDSTEWKRIWDNRDEIKEEIYSQYRGSYTGLKEEFRGDKCSKISRPSIESREICVVPMASFLTGVYGEANLKIELIVAKKLLEWMGHPSVKGFQDLPSP
ncbi:hypothetical protein MHLP_03380 [Candidatus Mycoplasma haematolamae str. Purdue]|uniref:Uncharacterized protein n=1 Tax=Mycoplasma haematolamae (strain Purdue) TaxID=1212765 RepID=I7CG76_MYCHA|nr:hypothetical protein [Candidatus Mycoplasma haematolamae]AFO52256.1 hypothetical protein MHLP_03380 [Candidatus Mycoplasma haematolamae str. Purdue]